jgi:HIV Tat-specific factor 1
MAMEDGQWKFQAADGISYSYSNESNAWFVTVPDDLLKAQQSIYGVHGVDESIPERPLKRKTRDPKPKEEKKQEIKNTAVYVSGVPEDATIAEMIEVFKRGGLFFTDPTTGLPKIKLYADINGKLKGDALVMYLREESVALACDLIDDTKFRDDEPGKILVQPAEFKTKDPSEIKEAGPTVDKRKKQKAMEKLNRQLLWDEDAQVSAKKDKHSKMVVLKHMFTKKELESSPALILDLKSEVRQECEKLGAVTNVVLYDVI